MTLRRRRLVALSVLLSCCILAALGHWLLTHSTSRSEAVDLGDLLLEKGDFPPGWNESFGPTPLPHRSYPEHGAKETMLAEYTPTGYEFEGRGSEQVVYRYRNSFDAALSFYSTFSRRFRDTSDTVWQSLEGLSFESAYADRARVECAESTYIRPHRNCIAVIQYQEFISELHVGVLDEKMSFTEFEMLLRAIDAKAEAMLDDP